MSIPLIQIQHVTKSYTSKGQQVQALKGVSLDIKQGEIFGLLGVNGAGKTTLSSILATLHPATSGDILFNGVSIYKDIFNYRKSLGFCPQYQNLDPLLSVEENLIFAGRYFLIEESLIRGRVKELMQEFELTRYAKCDIETLSGGTKQRVLIARSLVHKPLIVILDEPTVGLDPDIRKKLWHHIKKLKSLGITVILTTHYLDEAEVLSDRVCILNKGKVVLIETVENLKETHKKATLEDVFLHLVEEQQRIEP